MELRQLVTGVLAHGEDGGKENQVQLWEVEAQVLDRRGLHRQVREHGHEHAAAALNQYIPRSFLFPQDGKSLDGPRNDDHGEEGNDHAGADAQLIADDAKQRDHKDHKHDERRDTGDQEQVEAAQVTSHEQSENHYGYKCG